MDLFETVKAAMENERKPVTDDRPNTLPSLCSEKQNDRPDSVSPPDDSIIEAAPSTLSRVYWLAADGKITGPARVLAVVKEGAVFYLFLDFHGQWILVNADALRSRHAHERQQNPPCACCGYSDFWRSAYRDRICRTCFPPASLLLEIRPEVEP